MGDFLQFDVNKNNIQNDADYLANAYRTNGITSGVAPSNVHNKIFYQVTTMMAALAAALTAKGYTISDSDLASLITTLGDAIAVNPDWDATSGVAQILNKPSISAVPTGTILSWPTQNAPTGYLECNGSSLLIANYSALFSVIGNDYGAIDGTHFNLPDYRGYFLRGWDHSRGIDPDRTTRTDRGDGTSGDHIGTKEAESFKSHTHGIGGQTGDQINNNQYYVGSNNFAQSGATGGNETRPININVLYIIKT
jgi:microcystin-dependent protein